MIISISGVPGSGKTSVAKILAERLGMNFYSMGGLRGKMALERGITINALNKVGEQDPTTDSTVDDYQRELGKKEDNFIIEGRLSWHFIPHSFKIFLTCDPHEAARRIFEARKGEGREDEPEYKTLEDAERAITERMTSDALRYRKYYDLDYRDTSNYDLVVDTTTLAGAQATAERVQEELKNLP